METIIDSIWQSLYSHNSKIQAFAVCKDSEVIWQTSNWNPASNSQKIVEAIENASDSVNVDGVAYNRVSSTQTSYVSTAKDDQGHFLAAQAGRNVWVIVWASPSV